MRCKASFLKAWENLQNIRPAAIRKNRYYYKFYISLIMETEQTDFQIIQTMLLFYLRDTEATGNVVTPEESA